MRHQSLIERASERVSTIAGDAERDTAAAVAVGRIEDLRLRNYDGQFGYTVRVRAERDGEVVFAETYDLPPEATVSEVDAVDAGRYDLAVEMDGDTATLRDVRIDEWPEHTALVEVGNGVVSASTIDR